MAAGRRNVDQERRAAEADLRCAQREERAAVGADRSAVLPRHRGDRAPGGTFHRAGAEHHRQDPGDRRRHPGDRGSDLSRDQHQRHRLLLAAAVRSGGRSVRARLEEARKRRQGHQHHGIGLHDHGGPAGRLAEGVRGQARHQRRPGRARMGGCRGVQEDVPAVPGARLPHPPALGGLPQPHALERVHRRRRRDLAAAHVAEALQRVRRRGRAPHRHAGRTGDPRGAREVPGLPPCLDRERVVARGVRRLPADAPDAAPVHRRVPRPRRPDPRADAAESGCDGN